MIVEVHLYSQSSPVRVDDATTTYTKDGLYCVMQPCGTVSKFPYEHIFRVKEIPNEK